jgi:periplasmic mercuric ion binding protein
MKNKFKKQGIFAILLMTIVFSVFAQGNKTEKFKVWGNCEMCKARIEKAAKSVNGVDKANWDIKSKILEVNFNSSKTNLDKIELAVANVGHDTQLHRANDKTYNDLPGCCKYERKK